MSGFCGWFGPDRAGDPRTTLERMAGALPNYWTSQGHETCGPGFGLALRSSSSMGAFAKEPEIVATIEGYPEWSDPVFRDVARANGHARALLAAYKRNGPALLEILRGAFSFALIDLTREKALFAIDRFGIQTLCYAQPAPGLVVFGSTTDAVRAHPKVGATVSIQSIFDYVYFVDRLPAPTTIYREQRKLAPAEYLLVERGHAEVRRYWQMPYRGAGSVAKTAAAEEMKLLLRAAVAGSLAGEHPDSVGAFLSGGLDSSSVVGIAAGLLPQKLKTFTIGFPVEGFDEAYYADIAANHFRTAHQTYYLRPEDVVDILPKAAGIYDEPFANSSIVPAYYCARLAKDSGVEMMLAGDGGDELFAGNKRYAEDGIFDHYRKVPSLFRERLLEPVAAHLSSIGTLGLIGKLARYVERAKRPVPERMADNLFRVLSPRQVLTTEALRQVDLTAPQALAASIYDEPAAASKVQRMMQFDLRVTLADSDLRKVCRMCELAGVRTRFPFLNDELAAFSASLPETLLMEGGKLRQFYKDAMRGFLPEAIINKQKHGFGLPYLTFMNSHEPLRELVCDSLTTLKNWRYFRDDFLDDLTQRASNGHLSGHEAVAWDLVVLGLWLESRK